MRKRLVHEKVVTEAQDLLADALSRRPGVGKRTLRAGMLVRYYFHAIGGHPPEAVLLQGFDRVELLRRQEPRAYLAALGRWVFGRDLCILPEDSRHPRIAKQIDAKVAAKRQTELA